MNKEWKTKWIAALRSGKYKQTTGKLKHEDGFCCLGVLCDISKLHVWADRNRYFTYDGSKDELPESVAALSEVPYNVQAYLGGLNDRGKTFEEIAQWIEDHL